MPHPCTVFAPLGPNPAPLTELVYELARTHAYDRFDLHLVVEARARHFLDAEVLAPGEALDQLRDHLGATALPDPIVHEARDEAGSLITDDVEPEARAAYVQAVWRAAQQAVRGAGEAPVVFALAAGRRRTMTALQTAVFQLLARPQDSLLDVRVSDARVEGGTGFFFPAQPGRFVLGKRGRGIVDARAVDVVLVPLDLPRLAAYVPPGATDSLESARAATVAALTAAAPPRLQVDLHHGRVLADGERVPLSPSEFPWYAFLCVRRREGEAETWTRDIEGLRAFLRAHADRPWQDSLPITSVFAQIRDGDDDDEDSLATWRAYVTKRLRAFVKGRRAALERIVPRARRTRRDGAAATVQSLAITPAFIEIFESPGPDLP